MSLLSFQTENNILYSSITKKVKWIWTSTVPLKFEYNIKKCNSIGINVQGSFADGFLMFGSEKSDVDYVYPLNQLLNFLSTEDIALHCVEKNPAHVIIEVKSQNTIDQLNELIEISDQKYFLSIIKLKTKIIQNLHRMFSGSNHLGAINSDKHKCFTFQFCFKLTSTINTYLQEAVCYISQISTYFVQSQDIKMILKNLFMSVIEICMACEISESDWIDINKLCLSVINPDIKIEELFQVLWENLLHNTYFSIFYLKSKYLHLEFRLFLIKILLMHFSFCGLQEIVELMKKITSERKSDVLKEISDRRPNRIDQITYEILTILIDKMFSQFYITSHKDKIFSISFMLGFQKMFANLKKTLYYKDHWWAREVVTFLEELSKSSLYLDIENMIEQWIQLLLRAKFKNKTISYLTFMNLFQSQLNMLMNALKGLDTLYQGKELDMFEIVPSLKFNGWPSAAEEWINRKRYWPDTKVIESAVKDSFHVVFKSSPKGNDNLEGRLSFSSVEVILIATLTNRQLCCLYMMKALLYQEFSSPKRILSSYFMKTICFWYFESKPKDFWEEKDAVGECIINLIQNLSDAIQKKYLSHYFIKTHNLFLGIDENDFESLITQVDYVCSNFLLCLDNIYVMTKIRSEGVMTKRFFHNVEVLFYEVVYQHLKNLLK